MVNINTLWERSGYITDVGKLMTMAGPDSTLTRASIKAFLDRQEVNQLFHRPPKRLSGHIVAFKGNDLLQMDLLDFQKLKRFNRGNAWILIAVDVFTRYAYAIPLKRKTMDEVHAGLLTLLQTLPGDQPLPKRFMSDNGTEFLNRRVEELFELYNIEHDTNEVGDHKALGIIDRFSRTIRERLERHFAVNETSNWVDHIAQIVASYNDTPHSTLNMRTPSSIEPADHEIYVDNIIKSATPLEPRLKPGDQVRRELKRHVFSKGTKQRYTKEVFTVKEVKRVNVVLNDGSIERIERLLKVVPIEEVVR